MITYTQKHTTSITHVTNTRHRTGIVTGTMKHITNVQNRDPHHSEWSC